MVHIFFNFGMFKFTAKEIKKRIYLYIYGHCDKIPDKNQNNKGRIYFVLAHSM